MKGFWSKVDRTEFVVPAVLTLIVLIIGVVAPEAFGKFIDVAFNFVTNDLGWFYDLGIFALLTTLFIQGAINGAGLLVGLPSIAWFAFLCAMYVLEVLVAFLQAYVFTILSAVYVGLATSSH